MHCRFAISAGLSSRALLTLSVALAGLLLGSAVLTNVSTAAGPIQTLSPVGTWFAQTEDDGYLTLVITPDGKLSYAFSGGKQEHASGKYRLGDEEILFTPDGETEAESWDFGFDSQGRMVVEMEEDNPADEEEYVLTRAR